MPAPGIRVETFRFWSASNHCGQWTGADLIGQGTSDAQGVVEIPDGQFTYGLKMMSRPYAPAENPKKGFHWAWISDLELGETVIRVKKLEELRLKMKVTRGGRPAAGESLRAIAAYHEGCGTDYGHLAQTGEQGDLDISDFCPTLYSLLYFQNADHEQVKQGGWAPPDQDRIWSMDPADLLPGQMLQIDLPLRREAREGDGR
jgi:hypothetical protein